jgi:two-component system sensor kinase FixL
MNYVRAGRRTLERLDGPAPDKLYEFMDKAIAQADRAGQIIHHLREFVQSGEADRRLEDLNRVIQDASALALADTSDLRITVRYDLAQGLPHVLIDRVQIQQVIFNLVRNSVEALADSRKRSIIIKTKARAKQTIEVTVADSGPGLPPEVSKQLFQPFVTTKSKGMGIGLSICRSIIDEHGGRMWATSGRGGGTIFHFTTPLAAEDEIVDA